MIRWIFIIAWGMHGLGHIIGITGPFSPISGGLKTDRPWLLPGDVLVTSAVGKLWAIFWLAALLLIVASAWGLYSGAEWWGQVALAGAFVSLVAILPWAATVPFGAVLGALFDVAVIAMLLVPMDQLVTAVES